MAAGDNPKDRMVSQTAQKINKKELEEMMACACHFGHKVSKWNPKMRDYIYTQRDNIHIFDLVKSFECMQKALDFLRQAASSGKTILLMSTKLQLAKFLAEAAIKCDCSYVTRKWMPGLLTNYETIRKRIKYFKDLKEKKASGDWEKYTKKERLTMQRTLDKLEGAFSGVETMAKLPDVVVVFDCVRDILALKEANRLGITTVGVCDSNADPDLLTYPIPGNDDAVKSLKYFLNKIVTAIEEGKKSYRSAPQTPQKKENNNVKLNAGQTV